MEYHALSPAYVPDGQPVFDQADARLGVGRPFVLKNDEWNRSPEKRCNGDGVNNFYVEGFNPSLNWLLADVRRLDTSQTDNLFLDIQTLGVARLKSFAWNRSPKKAVAVTESTISMFKAFNSFLDWSLKRRTTFDGKSRFVEMRK